MRQITNIRKAVCVMANQLKKAGYTLTEAFRKAWQRVKLTMKVRAAGVTAENRQERLEFLKFRPEDLSVTLEREPDNRYDSNAIQIVIHIRPIHRRTVIGYVPRVLAESLAKVIDMGIHVKASLMGIIGGCSYKETLGVLIDIAV